MAKMLMCPCGEQLVGRTDDDFVTAVDAHLQAAHEGRTYPASMILQMAQPYPDDQLPS
jgi:hypothetical protein